MTKIIEYIKNSEKTLFSFEIIPPLKGQSIQSLFNAIEPLMEFKPKFIDVTYHREEYVYRDRGQGLLEKHVTRKRTGTVGICAAIMHHFQIDAVPHLICGGFNKEETENALIDLNFLGVDNVLVLRGDAIKSEGRFHADPNGHKYASELLGQVVRMNNGEYLDDELKNPYPSSFCIGVAGYPEKHFEAPNFTTDMKYLKMKVDMGAEYIVTQMFFDNQKYDSKSAKKLSFFARVGEIFRALLGGGGGGGGGRGRWPQTLDIGQTTDHFAQYLSYRLASRPGRCSK